MDQAVFRWINGWPPSLSPVFVFFSEATKAREYRLTVILVLAALIAAMVIAGGRWRTAALCALLAWPLANEFSEAFKLAVPMLRPCNELPDVIMYVGKLGTFGTVSSHAANMAAIAFVFTYYTRWWGAPWVLVAALTGVSRVYVGVHYPSQVLLGWIAGCLCGLIVVRSWSAIVALRNPSQTDFVPQSDETSQEK